MRYLNFYFFLLAIFFSFGINAQISVDSAYADNVQTCLKPEKVVTQVSVGAGSTGSYLEAKLPNGFNYAGFISGVNSNGGTVTYGGLLSGWHRFNISATTNTATVKVVFNQFATCVAGVSSYTARDSFRFFNGTVLSPYRSSAFNGDAPDLSITAITHSPATATIGTVVTRSYTITNGGFGATSNFIIVDKADVVGEYSINTSSFVINPSGVNYSIPAGQITTSGDSIIVAFNAVQVQQIADADTLFENGENFVLQYDLTINTCTPSSVLTDLLASWRCPNTSRCTYYSVATGISTFGPAAPNIISAGHLTRRSICYDGSTVWRDTLRVRNTGGPASNIKIDATSGYYSNNSRTDGGIAYLDTASFKVKINSSGTWFKPSYTVTQSITSSNTSAGCSYTGRPNQVSFTIPTLGSNDTIFVIIGQVICDFQFGCVPNNTVQNIAFLYGTAINVGYQNACASATYPTTWHVARGFTHNETNFINTGPGSIGDGETKDLSFDIANMAHRFYTSKGNFQIIVKLPGVIVFDPAFTNPVYFTSGANTYYPHSRNGDTFTFKSTSVGSLGTELHIQSIGQCDGVTCSGLLQYDVEYNINPDTTSCTTRNRKVCVQYPIAWTTSCVLTCCPEGMINKEYTLNRINYGQGDDNNNGMPSGVLDLTKINTKRTIPGDTIEIVHKSVILTSVAFPSFEYLRSIMDVSSTAYYSVVSDSVWVDRADSRPDSIFNHTPYALSGTSYVTDLSFMDTFKQGDSITIKLKLRVISNPVGSFHSYSSRVNGGASRDNFVTNKACGAIIDQQNIFGIDNFAYSAGQYSSSGCDKLTYVAYNYFRITGGNDRYSNYKFPFEYRPFAEVKQMRVSLPKGWVVDSVEFSTVYNKNTYLPVPSGTNLPFTMVNDTLVSWRPGAFMVSEGGTQLPLDEGHLWVYVLHLTPTCKVENTVFKGVPVSDSIVKIASLHRHSYPFTAPHPGGKIRNIQPNITVSSATPVTPAYGKVVSWPLAVSNFTTFTAVRNWLYFTSISGDIVVDSVKQGATLLTPDVNGFFRIGDVAANGTNNFTVYAKSNSCNFDSLYAYPGYSCGPYPTAFTSDLCSKAPVPLYVQPQIAAIQSAVTALASTPNDPANPGSGNFGASTIGMCESFPFEMELQSTQTGTIFNVTETLNLPTNAGNVGLEYVADSGYIEYPIGTTPRKFGYRGDSAILASIASGNMILALNLIDSINFDSSNGLLGTGLGNNNTRTLKLRWKMKSNCDLISGDQWTTVQNANSPCGSIAAGSGTTVSGFALNITGVVSPYVASVNVALDATQVNCGGNLNTAVTLVKIGTNPSSLTDSIFIRLPHTLTEGTISCVGAFCPGGAGPIMHTTDSVAAYKVLKFPFPIGLTTGDSLRYEFNSTTKNNYGCSISAEIRTDVIQRVSLLCNGTPCPNSVASLGNGSAGLDVKRPDLSIPAFTGVFMNLDTDHTYSMEATVENDMTADTLRAGKIVTMEYYRDENNNGLYDPGLDLKLGQKSFNYELKPGESKQYWASITNPTTPDPTKPIYAVIDVNTTPNCMCSQNASSPMIFGLPVEITSFEAKLVGHDAHLTWSTASEQSNDRFDVMRRLEGENEFIKVGEVLGAGNSNKLVHYSFIDPLEGLKGNVFYRLKQVDFDGKESLSKTQVVSLSGKVKSVSIYPNPAKDELNIRVANIQGTFTFTFVNALGQIVLSGQSNNSNPVDVSSLSNGVYFLNVYQGDRVIDKVSLVIE